MSTKNATKTTTKSKSLSPSNDHFKPWNSWIETDSLFERTLTIPALNITEHEDNYKVSVAIPGFKKEDFNIGVHGNILTISSEREEKKEEKEKSHMRKEYNYSSFIRTLKLPDEVNKDKIEAKYEEGLLKLLLPKKEGAKKLSIGKHINVK